MLEDYVIPYFKDRRQLKFNIATVRRKSDARSSDKNSLSLQYTIHTNIIAGFILVLHFTNA